MATVSERLVEFLKYKRISKAKFGTSIGVSSAYISSMRKAPSAEKIVRMREVYPELNITWLLTGNGSMLLNTEGVQVKPNEAMQMLVSTIMKLSDRLGEIEEQNLRLMQQNTEILEKLNGL